jgi:hypothetical protein
MYTNIIYIIFEHTSNEIIDVWRKLHNEELPNLYSSTKIIRMIKSRRMILAGHMASMGGEEECI